MNTFWSQTKKACWKKYKILVAEVEHIHNLFWIASKQCDFQATYKCDLNPLHVNIHMHSVTFGMDFTPFTLQRYPSMKSRLTLILKLIFLHNLFHYIIIVFKPKLFTSLKAYFNNQSNSRNFHRHTHTHTTPTFFLHFFYISFFKSGIIVLFFHILLSTV